MAGAGWKLLRETLNDVLRIHSTLAKGMTKSAGTFSILIIENHVVVMCRTGSHGHVVKGQFVTYLPGDDVIGTGCVAAESETANDLSSGVIEGQAATKNDHSSNWLADHRIVWRAIRGRVAEGSFGVRRGAGRQAVQAFSGLRCGEDVRGGERIVVVADSVGGICFGGGDHATAWPFLSSGGSAIDHRASDAIAIHQYRPLLISHAAVLAGPLFDNGLQHALQSSGIGKSRAIRFRLRERWQADGERECKKPRK